ncbi:hypothetical protein KFL_009500050 [Klebsormidium nitens]|uniref:MYND-type domain-containing protein n=1 Tax=Klebsormidium nitens TaxID=105231 RepID=A0A1Y1IU71_KLENI|nr:hypothetical protein KFL_009500050 [Klebsormidium nitens]|eukprot:GAQ92227.1 hypothetical protein KFL_009500050 [Klebsormidium nitens]
MDSAFVESFASRFLSDDPSKLLEALKLLDEARTRSRNLLGERVRFARAVQELAIYRQGSIIKNLTKQLLQEQEEFDAYTSACLKSVTDLFGCTSIEQLGLSSMIVLPPTQDLQSQAASILVLSRLATSKVVAQTCLTNKDVVKKLARNLSKKIARIETVTADSRDVVCTLQGIANFAHASKLFRQEMQAINMNLLPAVQKLLSKHYFFLSEEEVYASTESLARLIETLALSSDSRVWMIDTGDLQVMTELFRFERPANKAEKEDVISRCAFSLLRLLESKECLQKMRESDVFSLLKPYSSLLDNHTPRFWSHLENKLLDDAYDKNLKEVLPSFQGSHPVWKSLRRADFAVPTVCSWGDCTALESASTTAFSKCGRCGVARYCSKEHQKLHWPAHKKHCLSKAEASFGK